MSLSFLSAVLYSIYLSFAGNDFFSIFKGWVKKIMYFSKNLVLRRLFFSFYHSFCRRKTAFSRAGSRIFTIRRLRISSLGSWYIYICIWSYTHTTHTHTHTHTQRDGSHLCTISVSNAWNSCITHSTLWNSCIRLTDVLQTLLCVSNLCK